MKNNYTISEYKKLSLIKTDWEMLYSEGNFSYCQSFLWMSYIEKFCQSNIFKRMFWGNIHYIVIRDNLKSVLIAPIFIHKNRTELVGKKAPVDYFGFLLSDNNIIDVVKTFLRYLNSRYHVDFVDFGFLPTSQCNIFKTLQLLKSDEFEIRTKVGNSVALEYNFESFDDYFQSLSKSVRQNYRTAINRSKSDGLNFTFEYYTKIPKDLINKFLNDHKKRLQKRYSNGRPQFIERLLSPYRTIIYGKWRRDTPVNWSMNENTNHILCVAYLNRKPAAYYYGLLSENNNKKRINFHRVCVNAVEYGKYSPGIVLGIELIKNFGNKFSVYDFTIGEENYKYQLGCKNYENYWTTISLLGANRN